MKSPARICILGARGMLGTDLMACCRTLGIEVIGVDLPEFDLTNPEHLKNMVQENSLIVNCAAYTNVDRAEQEEEAAFQVNGYAVGTLGEIAAEADVPIIHISTDFVFDGKLNRPYIETDKPNPINVYGCSKLEGELNIGQSGCRCCILRVEWTYGRGGANFVKKILEAARTRRALRVVDDQIGSPTATREVADVICRIIRLDTFPEGIYHVAAEGYTSRYEMARFLCRMKDITVPVEPCRTADFSSPAQRPLNSRFHCTKLESLLGRTMRPWQDPLKEYLEQL